MIASTSSPSTRKLQLRMGASGVAIGMLAMCASTAVAQGAPAGPANGGPAWAAVQEALGGRGTMQPGDVLRFGFPRSDLQVTVDGVAIKPALALGSWSAFKRTGANEAVVTGDLVLTEDEVNPVMLALQQGGVEQTGDPPPRHQESPRILYMHIIAHGDPAKIAQAIRTALGSEQDAVPPGPRRRRPLRPMDLDTGDRAERSASPDKVNGGVYQVSVPRAERITDHGVEMEHRRDGNRHGDQLPAHRLVEGGDHGRLRDARRRGEPRDPRPARERDQVTALHSHMLDESTAALLHALLGERRRREAGAGAARRARPDKHPPGGDEVS